MAQYFGVQDESYKWKCGRIGPKQPIGHNIKSFPTSIELFLGKQDFAVAQAFVSSDTDFSVILNGACAYISNNRHAETLRVAVSQLPLRVDMYHEKSLQADNSATYADILDPSDACDYPADAMAPVYIRFSSDEHTPAGTYEGTVRLLRSMHFSDEEVVGEIALRITVFDCLLTKREDSAMYLDLWQYNSNIARHADVKLFSDEHFAVLDKYYASLGALGQKAVTVCVSEAPWYGHSCMFEDYYKANLFEFSIIPVKKTKDGAFRYDFSLMQRLIDMAARHGIRDEISLYGILGIWPKRGTGIFPQIVEDYSENIRIRYLDETDGTYKYMQKAEDVDDYIRAIHDYFVATEQIDRVLVSADEPDDIDKFRCTLTHLRRLCPRFFYKSAGCGLSFMTEFGDCFRNFTPSLHKVQENMDELQQIRAKLPACDFCWYVACNPERPNMFLHSPLVESFLVGFLNSRMGFRGFLRWNYTAWTDEPRRDIRFRWPAGDLCFVYPGANGEPLLTLRYFALMRGLQYYDLLQAYRRLRGEQAWDALVSRVLLTDRLFDTEQAIYSYDYSVYEDIRRELLTALSEG